MSNRIEQAYELLQTKNRVLQQLKKQAAIFGNYCPAYITIEIEDLRDEITSLIQTIRQDKRSLHLAPELSLEELNLDNFEIKSPLELIIARTITPNEKEVEDKDGIDRLHPRKIVYQYTPQSIVDFIFANKTNYTAVLWQVGVEIISSEINPKPILSFTPEMRSDKNITVKAINNGGNAINCIFSFSEKILDVVFLLNSLNFSGNIPCQPDQAILSLDVNSLNLHSINTINKMIDAKRRASVIVFDAINKDNMDVLSINYPKPYFSRRDILALHHYHEAITKNYIPPAKDVLIENIFNKAREGLPVENINVNGVFQDVHKNNYILKNIQTPTSRHYQLWFDENGFFTQHVHDGIFASRFEAKTMYVPTIEPFSTNTEIKFPITRQVPSNEVERFHIALRGTRAAKVKVRFKFYVDAASIITSEPFDITLEATESSDITYLRPFVSFERVDGVWTLFPDGY